MVKQIRMSEAEARAAGLLDPDVAHMASALPLCARQKARRKKKPSKDPVDHPPKTKTARRSRSRPAVHPKTSLGPAGTGSVSLLSDDSVESAAFVFDLVPVPKERARVVKNRKTGQMFGYTPARTQHFSNEVRRVVDHVFDGRSPIEGPVKLDMTFVMQVPASWPKWKRAAALEGLIAPTGRPDMDNLEKALLDALNAVAMVDDSYVVDRSARKIYGEVPAVMARIEKTGQASLNVRRQAIDDLKKLRENDACIPAGGRSNDNS